jgi:hypothetical protein
MLLCIIGLTLLCGLMSLAALVSIAGALLSSLRRADQGTPFLALVFPQKQRDLTKSDWLAEKSTGRRKTW